MRVVILFSAMLSGGCVSFATQMQQQGCRLAHIEGSQMAYSPTNGQMWVAPGRSCYVCPQYRTMEQAANGERPTYTICR